MSADPVTIGIEELDALEKRVREATGPDRRLDGEIDVRLNDGDGEMYPAPYTTSLDATLALVERVLPGVGWAVSWVPDERLFYANVKARSRTNGWATSPPLALLSALIAALRAKAGA